MQIWFKSLKEWTKWIGKVCFVTLRVDNYNQNLKICQLPSSSTLFENKPTCHCDKVGGNSSSGGRDGPKSIDGNTPGGLSRGWIDNNWDELPTTSAHP